ncbi:hypothetical protein B0H10DRAFT_1734973, partial [Mycena sp. CBHHK59/15]
LVESWRSDMDGILIFAGLFPASVTAFIIESYQTLTADSAETTILMQQITTNSNGTSFTVPALPDFVPATSSLICNALWFISL